MFGRILLVVSIVGCLFVPLAAQPASADAVSDVTELTFGLTEDVSALALGEPAGESGPRTGPSNATTETNDTEASRTGSTPDGTDESAGDTNSTAASSTENGTADDGAGDEGGAGDDGDEHSRYTLAVNVDEALNGTLTGVELTTETTVGDGVLADPLVGTGTSTESGGIAVSGSGGDGEVRDADGGVRDDGVGLLGPALDVNLGAVAVEDVSLDRLLSTPLVAVLDVPNLGATGDVDPTDSTPAVDSAPAELDVTPTPSEAEREETRRGDGQNETTGASADESGGESTGDGDGSGDGPGSAAGTGAALFVVVGSLGGAPLLSGQSTALGPLARRAVADVLRQTVGLPLAELGRRVLPVGSLFGYSRHDDSDPLENETRARIYDLVGESPGIYYAQLAAETDVTEETVRYHGRVLEKEGLVECRKLRGRRRLYPVTMDGGEPELDAAMVDSAASNVLDAIERREPTTLSAVAEAIDCAPSTVAYHLDRLEEDGLVSRQRDGGSVRIRLQMPTRARLEGSVADD